MAVLKAFTVEHAARATGVSERRIRYWDQTGVLTPSLASGGKGAPFGRIYSFRDLVGLRTLKELRDTYGLTLQELRRVGERLQRLYDAPWSSLRFSVEGGHLYFHGPESCLWISAIRPGQAALPLAFELGDIVQQTEAAASELVERRPEDIGKIVRNRHVLGNRPILSGTRIPTAAVWDFHEAGYDAAAIIKEYPRLTELDVRRAIAFEENQRKSERRRAS
jgi:uncharacterized protein (DUF433 family)